MSTFGRQPERDTGQGRAPLTSSRDRFYAGASAGATALIVEDDYRNMFALSAVLQRGKMVVVTADSGSRALDVLERKVDIGIVLMDIMMPVMDGYQAIAEIRKRPQCAELPIIAVTGKAAPVSKGSLARPTDGDGVRIQRRGRVRGMISERVPRDARGPCGTSDARRARR